MTDVRTTWNRAGSAPGLVGAATRIAEVTMFVGLLILDFELGVRLPAAESESGFVAGALATALVAIVVAAAAVARHRLPVRLAVGIVFGVSLVASLISAAVGSPYLSLTEAAAVALVMALALRESTPRGAVVVTAAGLVVIIAGMLLRAGVDLTLLPLALLIWGCGVAAGIAGKYLTTKRESAIEAARRTERMELARELHDVVAHQVTGIVVHAQAALAVAPTDSEHAAQSFAAIESAGAEALAEMRRMVGAIRDDAEPGSPLTVRYGLADIPPLVDRFDPVGARTTLVFDVEGSRVLPGLGESVYRIVREALTNVQRHAPGATTWVSVRVVDDHLVIDVKNDRARPFASAGRSKGFGLEGMQERVKALGGTMQAGSDETDSWLVRVVLPLGESR